MWQMNENEKEITIESTEVSLKGILALPKLSISNTSQSTADTEQSSNGIIIFAHGSGSGRLSPRNLAVARSLQQASLGTLLLDLLTEEEALNRSNVFDMRLLADRVEMATKWLQEECKFPHQIGYFGASTGAGAAIIAAAELPELIYAVVSRGGRVDLAGEYLPKIKAPTLLIVGEEDGTVITLNKESMEEMNCTKELKIIPNATHLFEEPGALEEVAEHAKNWFINYLNKK